jgi:hypothetical protein
MKIRNNVRVDRGAIHRATRIELVQTSHENSSGVGEFQAITVKVFEENNETAIEHKFEIFSDDNSDVEVDLQGQFQLTLSNKED